jgi:hypothetical protein
MSSGAGESGSGEESDPTFSPLRSPQRRVTEHTRGRALGHETETAHMFVVQLYIAIHTFLIK